MPLYICECCDFSTKIKSHLSRHKNTKKHLDNINMQNEEYDFSVTIQKTSKNIQKTSKNIQKHPKTSKNIQTKFMCDYCEKEFTLFANKRRHEIHRCKHRYDDMSYKKLFIESKVQMEKDKKEFKKQIEILLNKVGDTTINNTQNIQLNSYGNETMDHITDTMKTQFLKMPYGMIPKMIEAVHFNNDKPENKNIVFTNKKDNRIKVYSDDKWIYKDKDDIIHDLIDGKYFILDNHYNSVFENMNISSKSSYEKFRSFFDEKDKELHDQLKKECELVLLNNR